MKTRTIVPCLLIAVGFVTPAPANWFHNPYQGINRNIGSAPNPTPADIREMRLPRATDAGQPMLNYTVVEPAKDASKTADASSQPKTAPQAAVAAASPSR